jgi:hypothetical protein
MSPAKELTARGVKVRLTRAGVDRSKLEITDVMQRFRHVDLHMTGAWKRRNTVVITGTRDERRKADDVLSSAGFWCAPYPDRSEWHA